MASSTTYPNASWELEKVKKVKSLQEVENFARYVPEGRSYPAWVKLGEIVGTSTEHLTGCTWDEMRGGLQPKNSDEQYIAWGQDNLDHSEESSYAPSHVALRRDVIYVRQYGDEYFLSDSGNHRLCHAKFAGVTAWRVQLERCFMKAVK